MKCGYARVSTDDQTPALQLAALKKTGCKIIFKDDGLSGATTKRPALQRCLKKLESGDTLIVWKLDRLGRSLADLIRMLDDFKKRGVKFRIANGSDRHRDADRPRRVVDDRRSGQARTQPYQRRTRAGVKAAKGRGVKFGRKPKLTALQIELARKQIARGEERGKVTESFKVNRTTLYRALAVSD